MSDYSINAAALTIPCGRCEAKIGEPCRTITGHPAPVHQHRSEPLDQAYGNGYSDGYAAARLLP